MPISNYPNGFPNGVNIRGLPLNMTHPGNVYWVHSGTGSNGNKGTFDRPFSSIDYAVGRCTADQGDIIMVKPGHTETVTAAAGLDLDVAGIAIVGLGAGSLRPTVNFTTATTADMDVDAANITVVNLLFTGGIDALVAPIDVNAADFSMINCETRDVTGQAVDFIDVTTTADRFYSDGWVHRGATAAGADTAITINGTDGTVIKNFWIDGEFAVAAIENVTTAATNLNIYGDRPCFARTRNAADCIVTAVSTATGNIGPNIYARVADHAANFPGVFVGDDMQHFAPLLVVNLDGEAGGDAAGTASTSA